MRYAPMPEFAGVDVERFWQNIHIGKPHECWPWKLTQFTGGYGQFKVNRRNLKAHRAAYYLHYGVDPASNLVCHRCDNPVCCNPFHLFLGTERENAQDCKDKGRLNPARGAKHGSRTHPERWARGEQVSGSKLTLAQVQEIRSLYATHDITQDELAARFGVTRRAVGMIIKGKNWRHAVAGDEPVSLSDPKRRGKPGEANHSAKLTSDAVRAIRRAHTSGTSVNQLASQHGVTRETIYFILKRRTWSHLPD